MKNRDWSEQENRLLVEYYYTLSLPSVLDMFPDRKVKDIHAQVAILKRKNIKFKTVR
jgi:hypothetical protein